MSIGQSKTERPPAGMGFPDAAAVLLISIPMARSLSEALMPLIRLPAPEAYERASREYSAWPRSPEKQAARLTPLAKPQFTPSFKIDRDQLIFTLGSCFARNIERDLIGEGCNVAVADFQLPSAEREQASNEILNRFVCFSILNELRWALSPDHPFPEASYVELRQGRWFDMNNVHEITPVSFERVVARREAIRRYMARAAEADVLVITLGLAEAWFDTATGLYVNIVPHRSVREKEPDRYEFHLLDYGDIVQCLDDIHALISQYGKPNVRFLVTVSPVTLGVSFSGNDALVGNTYSKAVQRAAVECFVRRYDNVDYFPSFESVTLSDRTRAWRADQAHASDEIIRLNVLRMTRAYLNDARTEEAVDRIERAHALAKESARSLDAGDLPRALEQIATAAQLAPEEPAIRLQYANALLKNENFLEAIEEALAATRGNPMPIRAYFTLGLAYLRAGFEEDSYLALKEAVRLHPRKPSFRRTMALVCERLGRYQEGLEHIDFILDRLQPEDALWGKFSADRMRLQKNSLRAGEQSNRVAGLAETQLLVAGE